MGKHPKQLKLLFHLTAFDNLEQILKEGLSARGNLAAFHDVADDKIIAHRKKHNLNGYVPFHFFAGTPFAGQVQQDCKGLTFVFLTILRTLAKRNNFKILTQHPLSLNPPILHPFQTGIELIDWDLMGVRDYCDQDCKNCCMAECLSENTVFSTDIYAIYCKNGTDKQRIDDLLTKLGKTGIYVNCNSAMFKK